jgi:predicted nucleotidyltransferase
MKHLKLFIKEQKEQKLKGLNNVTTTDIIDYVEPIINEMISDNDLNIKVKDYYVHGSRVFGNPRQDSDIDVVLYYEGNIKEDALFNILHDDEYKDQFIYDDIEIDVNPIRDEETGSLQKYIEKDKNYKK